MLNDITIEFIKCGIKPNYLAIGDKKIEGSSFFSYRNDRNRNAEYVESLDATSHNESGTPDHPQLSILIIEESAKIKKPHRSEETKENIVTFYKSLRDTNRQIRESLSSTFLACPESLQRFFQHVSYQEISAQELPPFLIPFQREIDDLRKCVSICQKFDSEFLLDGCIFGKRNEETTNKQFQNTRKTINFIFQLALFCQNGLLIGFDDEKINTISRKISELSSQHGHSLKEILLRLIKIKSEVFLIEEMPQKEVKEKIETHRKQIDKYHIEILEIRKILISQLFRNLLPELNELASFWTAGIGSDESDDADKHSPALK
jgi:hypothetical protein